MMLPPWRREDDAAVALAYRLWRVAGGGAPVDIARLARRLGVVVEPHSAPPGVRGALYYAATPIIMVNAALPLAAQRYAVAHEIAHLLVDRRLLPVRPHRQERVCQRCAASLLIPPHLLVAEVARCVGRHDALAELAGHFVVSRQAMRIQLRRLRLLLPGEPAATPEQHAAALAPLDEALFADLTPAPRCHALRAHHLLPPPPIGSGCLHCPLAGGCKVH